MSFGFPIPGSEFVRARNPQRGACNPEPETGPGR
jgi:hypothetical protein